LTPVQLPNLSSIVAVSTVGYRSLALRSDGVVFQWGHSVAVTPVAVAGLSNVTAIAQGDGHQLALRTDGTVWSWGSNQYGQLGFGSQLGSNVPAQIPGLANVSALAAGQLTSYAVGRASPTQGRESFTASAPAGATLTTDVELDGATISDPIETTVTSPIAGTVSVVELTTSFPSGFSVAGRSVQISAPTASVANPLVISFRLDVSIFPVTYTLTKLNVWRNGVGVASCTGAGATPNPCVEGRTRFADGDVEIVVRTSAASDWIVGIPGPTADAGGPYAVAEGASVSLLGGASGGESPYAFQWVGSEDRLSDPFAASPSFLAVDDGARSLQLLVTDAAGASATDLATVTVTNALPAVGTITPAFKSLKVNTQIKVSSLFTDGGRLDTHTATWTWGDGKSNAAEISESNGSGTAMGNHVYKKAGTYTITLVVRDDDGGTSQRTLALTIAS
jgi:hypothetical protein